MFEINSTYKLRDTCMALVFSSFLKDSGDGLFRSGERVKHFLAVDCVPDTCTTIKIIISLSFSTNF